MLFQAFQSYMPLYCSIDSTEKRTGIPRFRLMTVQYTGIPWNTARPTNTTYNKERYKVSSKVIGARQTSLNELCDKREQLKGC